MKTEVNSCLNAMHCNVSSDDKTIVSIISPSYNSKETILATYESIVAQSIVNWEWLVTDDCSTDGTFERLNNVAEKDRRVKVFRNKKNSGAAVSRNNSLAHASGDYIAFIDSDDLWYTQKLEKQLQFMKKKEVDFSFSAYELIDHNGRKMGCTVDAFQSGCFSYEDMLKKRATLGCSTVMLRRAAFDDISMPLLRTGQDYALWLKLLKTGKNAFVLSEVLVQYRIRPGSISRNKFKKARRQWQIYREVEELALSKSIVCFLLYAWRAIFRK